MKTFKDFITEMGVGAIGGGSAGPTNTSGSGNIAGIGQPPGSHFGEPGVQMKKKKAYNPPSPVMMNVKRKKPTI